MRHAITDVYDEERRTFLVRFPLWFIVALGVSGVVVLGLTGFLGSQRSDRLRPDLSSALDSLFVALPAGINARSGCPARRFGETLPSCGRSGTLIAILIVLVTVSLVSPSASSSTHYSNTLPFSGRGRTIGIQPLVLCTPELWSAWRLCARFGAALVTSRPRASS